jgi:hypothetical protein
VVIDKRYENEYKFDGPQLEDCIFVVNQEEAFEAAFK